MCRKRKHITKRKSDDDSDSEFSLSDEAAATMGSDQAPSDTASFETDSELSDDPLGEYDDADEDMYEQRRHKYARGEFMLASYFSENLFVLQHVRNSVIRRAQFTSMLKTDYTRLPCIYLVHD